MTQLLTARTSVVAARIKDVIAARIDDVSLIDPPIRGVSYGDQMKVPETPWVCVEPSTKNRQWPPTATYMTEIDHEVTIFVYHTNLVDGVEVARLECDQVTEALEEYLNINFGKLPDAGGNELVVYGYVVTNEHGYSSKNGNLYHAGRMTWRGKVKVPLRVAQ